MFVVRPRPCQPSPPIAPRLVGRAARAHVVARASSASSSAPRSCAPRRLRSRAASRLRAPRPRGARSLRRGHLRARGRVFRVRGLGGEQGRLLEHYAAGLRGILAEADDLADPALVSRLRALRDDAPVRLEHPFWGAPFLAIAFGHELGFAAAHPPAPGRGSISRRRRGARPRAVPRRAVRARPAQIPRPPHVRPRRPTSPPPGPPPTTTPGAPPPPPPRLASPWELFASARPARAATLPRVYPRAGTPSRRRARPAPRGDGAERGEGAQRLVPGSLHPRASDADGPRATRRQGRRRRLVAGDEGTAREERARANGGGGGGGGGGDDDDDDDARRDEALRHGKFLGIVGVGRRRFFFPTRPPRHRRARSRS